MVPSRNCAPESSSSRRSCGLFVVPRYIGVGVFGMVWWWMTWWDIFMACVTRAAAAKGSK